MAESCANCQFYLAEDSACRRYPPATLISPVPCGHGQVMVQSEFPRMQKHGWCGEWRSSRTMTALGPVLTLDTE